MGKRIIAVLAASMLCLPVCAAVFEIEGMIGYRETTSLSFPASSSIKITYDGYDSYITPTMKEVDELVEADADIVALDCTMRKRGDGTTINDFIMLSGIYGI